MEFDVAGNITAGATILAAELRMTCTLAPDSTSRTFSLHRVTTEWGEVGSDPGGTVGGGATGAGTVAAVPGDATWNSSMSPTAWSTPGGDFVSGATRSRTINGTGTYTWTTSTSMVNDVQTWMTPANNHGWILRGPEASLTTPQARGFASREAATAADRPQLIITYRPPLL